MSGETPRETAASSMIEIVAVRPASGFKVIYCRTEGIALQIGDQCIIATAHGQELGQVASEPRIVKERYLKGTSGRVVRRATTEDYAYLERTREKEAEAYSAARCKIRELRLPMRLVAVRYTFDGSQVLFYFTAESRVDFREMVRQLAGDLRVRIEMKQIGVRDEARMLGGLGCCGRPLCCVSFLSNFEPVSIRMAKEQGLSLIPSKISGVCGRLMCCLTYEYKTYCELRARLPRAGKRILTPKGPGKIRQLNILKETVTVELEGGETYEMAIPPEGWKPPAAPAGEPAAAPAAGPCGPCPEAEPPAGAEGEPFAQAAPERPAEPPRLPESERAHHSDGGRSSRPEAHRECPAPAAGEDAPPAAPSDCSGPAAAGAPPPAGPHRDRHPGDPPQDPGEPGDGTVPRRRRRGRRWRPRRKPPE